MDYLNLLYVWVTDNISFDAATLFKLIIISQLAEFAWELYLTYRQHRIYKNTTSMPDSLIGITKKDTFEKARVYALDKSNYGFVSDIYNMLINMFFLAFNGLAYMWTGGGMLVTGLGWGESSGSPGSASDNELVQGAAFIVIMNSVSFILKLPFCVYYTFVLEEKHGFNKQTLLFFVKDKIKSFILMQIVSVFIVTVLTYIVMVGGKYFFLYLWLFAMAVTFFFMTIYPDMIAPLFDKYTPLPEGELRTQIENLAASIDFPLKKLYVVEGSKRSSHSNAYFYGFFKNKRIVLFDTLLKGEGENAGKGCSDSEVLAVLGHELGHWKLNHVLKNIILMQVNMLLVFVAFAALFKYKPLYIALGFESTPIIIGLTVLTQYVLAPYFFLLSWAMAQLSRSYEFAADEFAKTLGRCYSLKAALIKLNADNLGFPIYDPLYSSWHNSHPPLLERLHALEADKTD